MHCVHVSSTSVYMYVVDHQFFFSGSLVSNTYKQCSMISFIRIAKEDTCNAKNKYCFLWLQQCYLQVETDSPNQVDLQPLFNKCINERNDYLCLTEWVLGRLKSWVCCWFFLFLECRLHKPSNCRSFREIGTSWISSKKLSNLLAFSFSVMETGATRLRKKQNWITWANAHVA